MFGKSVVRGPPAFERILLDLLRTYGSGAWVWVHDHLSSLRGRFLEDRGRLSSVPAAQQYPGESETQQVVTGRIPADKPIAK